MAKEVKVGQVWRLPDATSIRISEINEKWGVSIGRPVAGGPERVIPTVRLSEERLGHALTEDVP